MRVSVLGYSGVRQVCITSPLLFNVYIDAVKKDGEEGCEISRGGRRIEIA